MAHLFRPIAVKPIPVSAEIVRQNGKKIVRWKNRNGEWATATLTEDGKKCRVKSPYWWLEWSDVDGRRQRKKLGKSRDAATTRMGEIVSDVQRQRDGLSPKSMVTTGETLHALAEEYRDHLRSRGRAESHYGTTFRQIVAVLKDRSWIRVGDVNVADWSRWVNRQMQGDERGPGISSETVNHYLRAFRGFFRWLIKGNRLGADPLAAAGLLNADADRRIKRRTLTASDLRLLIDTTRASRKVYSGLNGESRAAMYLLAARTGLRAGTLATLKPEDVRLNDSIPHIPTQGNQQKSGKEHKAPLSTALVDELREWIESRPAGVALWPGKWHDQGRGSRLVRWDLKEAGLPIETPDGTFDLHALRGQCGTDLALAGVPLVVTQRMLGHSTPALTAKYYVRVGLADLAGAANQVGESVIRELGRNSPQYPKTLAPRKGKASTKKRLETAKKSGRHEKTR